DLNVPASRYAPVPEAALRGSRPGFWLLGHVHQPRLSRARGAATLLYPGTPQPLDPGDQGEHGVWIVETEGAVFTLPRLIPIATVRYDQVTVDVSGTESVEEVQARIVDAVGSHREVVAAVRAPVQPEYVCCHLFLEGRTRVTHREIEERILPYLGDLDFGAPIRCRIDRVELGLRPLVDLEELSRGGDAPGQLASLLLRLERSAADPEIARLLEMVAEEAERVAASSAYAPLRAAPDGAPPLPPPEQVLRRQAYRLLEELIAQKEMA